MWRIPVSFTHAGHLCRGGAVLFSFHYLLYTGQKQYFCVLYTWEIQYFHTFAKYCILHAYKLSRDRICLHVLLGETVIIYTIYSQKKDGNRRQGKGRRVCLGEIFFSIPCRASCFASVSQEDTVEFSQYIWKKWLNSTVSLKSTETKRQRGKEVNKFCPPNRRDPTTFALPSASILLL